MPHKKSETKEPNESRPPSPKPYIPSLPFSQRFAKAKLDSTLGKLINVLINFSVKIPFIDASYQMPMLNY